MIIRNFIPGLLIAALASAASALLWPTFAGFYTTSAAAAEAQHTNRLADSFSPYLRQHAHNPVDWYSWGPEALAKARAERKPILLSIGYSTCYWCHVLEREVFSQKDVGALMNEHFINIKVDCEVRPDLDEIYMTATQLINQRGGWPNNVLLTPDLKPFFAVTYLPKPQWIEMVTNAAQAWNDMRGRMELLQQGDQIMAAVRRISTVGEPTNISFSPEKLADSYLSSLHLQYDNRYGGFSTGQKFPQETNLLFLLDRQARIAGDEKALAMVENTVGHMLAGGIHDHVGGGFHRYATDPSWHIPHFEKMLYNQGMMAMVLSGLVEQTDKVEYKRALTRLLDYVAQDMTAESGAFFSARDAETDAVEGAYYVWNEKQLETILGRADKNFLLSAYELTAPPHFSGHKSPNGKVLHRKPDSAPDMARLDVILAKLHDARQTRPKPLRDEKIVAAWNGMMIAGLTEAGRVLDNGEYVDRAEKAARFILAQMRDKDGALHRIHINGAAHQSAFLDDYAWLARGLMALYRVTGSVDYRDEALSLITTADERLRDKTSGGYYLTDGKDGPGVRVKQGRDTGSEPSGNAVMAQLFADLYAALGDTQWKARIDTLVNAFGQGVNEQAGAYGHVVHAVFRASRPVENWLAPVAADSPLPPAGPSKPVVSRDKVSVHVDILDARSSPKRKLVEITVDITDGWHLNANPASLDFLIPTVADIQTDEPSELEVHYPQADRLTTPLGEVDVYQGRIKIMATVISTSPKPIDISAMRLLLQVQACKDKICAPPSNIALPVAAGGC